jgi:hypothetical protein
MFRFNCAAAHQTSPRTEVGTPARQSDLNFDVSRCFSMFGTNSLRHIAAACSSSCCSRCADDKAKKSVILLMNPEDRVPARLRKRDSASFASSSSSSNSIEYVTGFAGAIPARSSMLQALASTRVCWRAYVETTVAMECHQPAEIAFTCDFCVGTSAATIVGIAQRGSPTSSNPS